MGLWAALLTPALAVSAAALWFNVPAAAAPDPPGMPSLGAHYEPDGKAIRFRLFSSRATRIDLYHIPQGADEKLVVPLTRAAEPDIWTATVPVATLKANGLPGTIYYGYRAWGPNWPFAPGWTKGTEVGFVADVDAAGNRFNPNRLLIDP
jgi:glycogen operon protein